LEQINATLVIIRGFFLKNLTDPKLGEEKKKTTKSTKYGWNKKK